MEIKDIFTAAPKSINQTLGTSNTGFYIPAYQRDYSWSNNNIQRLFSDCTQGLKHLVDNEDSITFIGSIIVIKDQNHTTIWPSVRQDLPNSVLLVIDGQQRLTTITLLNAILHRKIVDEASYFSKKRDNPAFEWIFNFSKRVEKSLQKTFIIDMDYPEENPKLRYYPSLIRAFKDSWSRDAQQQKYESPIASFLSQYRDYLYQDDIKNFEYRPNKIDKESNSIKGNSKEIIKQLNLIKTEDETIEFPSNYDIINSDSIKEVLFQGNLDPEVIAILKKDTSNKEEKAFKEFFRLIVFSQFILNRLALTEVIVKNEDYAFDMFEALNTTGEPLTAFETFKPDIIQSESLEKYEQSESKPYVDNIEKYLSEFKNYDSKQKATSNLLIPFRLLESGIKLTKKLNEQRNFLKLDFRSFQDIKEKRNFIQSLSYCTDFIKLLWAENESKEAFLGDEKHIKDAETNLCIHFLRDSKHQIIYAPLMRFYIDYRNSSDSERNEKLANLCDAIKAVTAFFIIWRSSRLTTDQIDAHYRTIMLSGLTLKSGEKIPPLARQKNNKPNIKNFKLALNHILEHKGNIVDKNSYIKKALNIPIYKISTQISKMTILTALDGTVSTNGTYEKGRKGINPLLSIDNWIKDSTVEHIAPQNPNKSTDDWDWNIYEKEETINTIGNLTLLPRSENSSISNKSWNHRRIFYKALSCTTEDELNAITSNLEKSTPKITFPNNTLKILNDSSYSYFVSSLGDIKSLDSEFIKNRSKNLLSLSWDKIISWLE